MWASAPEASPFLSARSRHSEKHHSGLLSLSLSSPHCHCSNSFPRCSGAGRVPLHAHSSVGRVWRSSLLFAVIAGLAFGAPRLRLGAAVPIWHLVPVAIAV
eukprot:scaffold4663_cov104-Isochrysis_galbana.AAC.6